MSTMLTEEQYLEIERQAETRSEFRDGEMFARDVSTQAHSHLSAKISALLDRMLPPDCMVFNSNLRIRIAATGRYTYPDCSAVRAECALIENPALIVEVLSASTEAYAAATSSRPTR